MTVVPPVKVLAAERTSVPAPLLAMAPAPALPPVPPEPVWSAMTLEMVWVTPEPGAKFTVPLPCRNMPEPKAEPAVPCADTGAARDGAAVHAEGAGDVERAPLLHEDRPAEARAAAAAADTGGAAVAAAKTARPGGGPAAAATAAKAPAAAGDTGSAAAAEAASTADVVPAPPPPPKPPAPPAPVVRYRRRRRRRRRGRETCAATAAATGSPAAAGVVLPGATRCRAGRDAGRAGAACRFRHWPRRQAAAAPGVAGPVAAGAAHSATATISSADRTAGATCRGIAGQADIAHGEAGLIGDEEGAAEARAPAPATRRRRCRLPPGHW